MTTRLLSFALPAVLVCGTLQAVAVTPAHADSGRSGPLRAQTEKLDHDGREITGIARPATNLAAAKLPPPSWPAAGSAIPARVAKGTGHSSAVVLARTSVPARWRAGVVARVSASGPATVSVAMDYSTFGSAYGAGWASRLRAWRLPECALTTPDKAGCAATPLPSRNDAASATVTADVAMTATARQATALVAVAAGPSGDDGDFTATPLSASSTWSTGGSAGSFNWSYPVRVPKVMGGPLPEVSFAYSSASVDGRSSASNNQPSWIGEGFEFSPGFIERRYVSCSDDKSGSPNNPQFTGDICWRSNNATMSLGGSSTELIYESGKGWHGRAEDGSTIEQLTGASNGDDNGEHWKVTTTGGTQYFFGLNKLPGQSTDTDSAWTVPVYGNHAGEPGHADKFADSRLNQAWRWNLDYAVDVHGNTMSFWYDKETNQYATEVTKTKNVSYVRGGVLKRIDYGTWDRGTADRSVTPVAQVVFESADRCLSDCSTHDGAHWPDTPWDQECKADATSCDDFSPTFWSTKRLAKVRTRIWDTTKATPAWQDVDSYTLTHAFPSPGDGQRGGLWLSSVVHTGHVGGTIAQPPVSFDPVAMPNRVLTKTNTTNNWQRMAAIHTETGAVIQVTYSLPECSSGNLPDSPQNNTKLCYPVVGPDPYSTDGGSITEWWHKYVVRQITETDVQLQDGHQAPVKNTYYTYEGAPAWHYADDDGLSKPKYKTWNQFRGFASVLTQVGDSDKTLKKTTYLRGMHGDKLAPSGGTRSVTVPASLGSETVYDEDQFAGMIREEVVYNGTTDKPVSKTVNVPWRSPALASRTINGDTAEARYTAVKTTYTGTALGVDGARGWRVTSQISTFDDTYGTVQTLQDSGDLAKSGDEKCTTTVYHRNTAKNLVTLARQVTTTALPCGTSPASRDQVISDAVTYYDGAASATTAPVRGLPTRTDELTDWTTAAGAIRRTTSRATYDAFGRKITATDARGNTTTTTYSPANGINTKRTDTTELGWVTTTEEHPAWAVPTKITDQNGRITEGTYDALGRTAEVWRQGWTRDAHPTQPTTRYGYYYSPTRSGYPYVRTETLNAGGGTDVSYEIFDGLLRSRQTQKAAVGGGRVVTDKLYDAHGRVAMEFAAHAEPDAPSGTLWWEPEWSVPTQTVNVYDRADRVTDAIFRSGDGVTNLVDKWHTRTAYEGDRVTVIPPPGGTPETRVLDVRGHVAELWQYTTAAGTAGAYERTRYTYNGKDQLAAVVDPSDNQWTYKYDMLGHKVEEVDPDTGKLLSEYNELGDLTKTTDARNEVLVYTYDSLGRKTALYDDAVADANKRSEWRYDKLYTGVTVRGQITEKIRYDNGNAYKWQARGFTGDYKVSGEQWVIPAAETGLAGTYVYGHSYSPYTGVPTSVSYPAAGGIADEQVTTGFDQTSGLATSLTSAWSAVGSYVAGQQYSSYGEPTVTTMKITGGVYTQQAIAYELDTRRMQQIKVKPETATGTVAERGYTWDPAGNLTSIADAPQAGPADTQCFGYDALRRLTSAWTPKAGVTCGSTPSVADLGGAAPYWLEWSFDKLGNRTREVSHSSVGDTVRDYTIPPSGADAVRPHAVTAMKTTGPAGTSTINYDYDNTGNLKTRGAQALTWDAEGKPASIVANGQTSTSVYDADGARLLRRDAGGTTLFLPNNEVRKSAAGISGTRYYTFNDKVVASRTNVAQSLTWLFDDHQGTQQVAVNAYTQKVDVRRQTPYGEGRGTNPAWPNAKGFVGGDNDLSTLVHIGARDYDPALGRFVSVDPVHDLNDPQQWNAYAYAHNNPTTSADPTGLWDNPWPAIIGAIVGAAAAIIGAINGGGGNNSSEGNCSRGTSCTRVTSAKQTPQGANLYKKPMDPCQVAPQHCQGMQNVIKDDLYYLLDDVVQQASDANIDPRLLLAIMIRESGDKHRSSWLDNSPAGWFHDFSVGIANMQEPAFEEAKEFANGKIDYDLDATAEDPVKSMRAGAFLAAKRIDQLPADRSKNFTDDEYARIGYRAGPDVMLEAARTGRYEPGLTLHQEAFAVADYWVCQSGNYVCTGS
ncbi:RHS repeat-associated core domain-containing protein [Actinoplanes oblitus]|uniref:RHS repeat-associated core domain-containing protein n=1 Tax=Actinoplanes oblitus TaxID=3040509 RepID=A0ABY8WS26_9ACTN|nr:RHS repeat-associated core domain-containing protein [Actinoplanes oblitus]WIN00449.1 RHS repeat-associated core domain-containing protein [Actinoplanes oblitus]